jgi:HisJ family histidinol phosphate phosphatase
MLFLWFYHACVRGAPRFLMASDHMNLLTFEDPSAVNLVRRALKLAHAGDLYGAAETANVEVQHAAAVSEGLRRRNMRYSIGAEVDNDPRCRPDAANIVDAMRPDGMIRAVHFIPIDHPTHGAGWQWAYDYPEFSSLYDHVGTENVWKLYTETLFNAIETLPGQVIAHFYKPAIFGHWPDLKTLEGYEDKLLEMCKERSLAIELNSRIFYKSDDADLVRAFRDANLRLLKKAKSADVMVAVGADAHSPRDQGGGFETVLELLDAAEINELAFPIAGRLARVALKVVREPERVPAAPPPVEAPAVKEPKRRKAVAVAPAEDEAAPAPVPAPKRGAKKAAVAAADDSAQTLEAPVAEPVAPDKRSRPPKPAAEPKAPAKAAAKPAPAKPAPAPPKPAPAKAAVAKAPAKPPAKAAAAAPKVAAAKAPPAKKAVKAAPARPPVKPPAKAKAPAKPAVKAATKTKPAAKAKPAVKPAAKAKPAAKKTAPKAAPKKAAARVAAPARKAAPAKKAVAKKTASISRPVKASKVSKKAPAQKKSTKSRR